MLSASDDDDIIYLFRMARLNTVYIKYTLDFFSVRSSYTQSYRHAILKDVK